MPDILGEAPPAKSSLWAKKSAVTKGADTAAGDDEAIGDDAPILRAFGLAQSHKKDEEQDGDEEEERRGDEDARSEGVSLPPSSRPSTPLSIGDEDEESEHNEPVEDEMEEDR